MTRAAVAVLKTSPGTVIDDYRRLFELIDVAGHLGSSADTVLAAELNWHHFVPACNTPPWQIEGAAEALIASGFDSARMAVSINGAVGVSVRHGEVLNRQRIAAERHAVAVIHPGADESFMHLTPSSPMRVLHRVYPEGIPVPVRLMGANAVTLPLMRSIEGIMVAGALYSGFMALLDQRRGRVRAQFAEALVDVLAIQREIHPGMIAVADGAFAGQGPDPRRLTPVEADIIAASANPVALDAVMARLMGYEPTAIPSLRLAAEAGLGVCNPRDIDLIGDDVSSIDLRFAAHAGVSKEGKSRKSGGVLSDLEERLSMIYHDWYWYTHHSEKDVSKFMKTGWGRLFEEYRK